MNIKQRYSKTAYMVLCGLFAALMAVCSYIILPLPFTPVPVNMGTLGVYLAGGLLGRKYGTVSVLIYIFMGLAGIPVFAGFQAGIGALAGPTGGYIMGYVAAAFLIGSLRDLSGFSPKGARGTALCMAAMAAGTLLCYLAGTLWFIVLTGTSLAAALPICILPFIPGDLLKILAAALIVNRLRSIIY